MTSRKPQKIAIIGAGLMGHGLALVFASRGHQVSITDPNKAALQTIHQRVADTLLSLELPTKSVDQITTLGGVAQTVADADFVVEAAPEKLELKQDLFAQIEASARPDAILASNTSVMPITGIMTKVKSKHRTVGTHWWNPPYLVPLVEVIQTAHTSAETVAHTMELMRQLGKTPVHVKKDVPGFVGNRLQHALWREAISIVENGICDAETVDLVVKNSFGRRLSVLGPLENADLVGTDLTLDIHNQILADLEDSKSPSAYLEGLVANGNLGFKSNQGFRSWTEEKKIALRALVLQHLKTINMLLGNQGGNHAK